MVLGNSLLNVYIDANVMIIVAFLLWVFVRFVLSKLGFYREFRSMLMLLNSTFIAVLISPFFVWGLTAVMKADLVGIQPPMNISDFAIALYLDGGFQMKASEFEQFLTLRNTWTNEIVSLTSVTSILIVIFLTGGFAVSVVRTLLSVWRLRSIIRNSFEWRRFKNIHIRFCETTHVPFSTRGLRNHYIIMPFALLENSEDLRMALAHEFQHLRQGDISWEIAIEFLRPLFFWNPAFILWKRTVDQLRELSCDQQVLSRKKYKIKDYGECLLRVCQNSLKYKDGMPVIVPVIAFAQVDKFPYGSNSVRFLKHRVSALFEGPKEPYSPRKLLLLVVPLMAIVVFSSIIIHTGSDWSQDRIMLSTIVNLERLDVINGFGK